MVQRAASLPTACSTPDLGMRGTVMGRVKNADLKVSQANGAMTSRYVRR